MLKIETWLWMKASEIVSETEWWLLMKATGQVLGFIATVLICGAIITWAIVSGPSYFIGLIIICVIGFFIKMQYKSLKFDRDWKGKSGIQ